MTYQEAIENLDAESVNLSLLNTVQFEENQKLFRLQIIQDPFFKISQMPYLSIQRKFQDEEEFSEVDGFSLLNFHTIGRVLKVARWYLDMRAEREALAREGRLI